MKKAFISQPPKGQALAILAISFVVLLVFVGFAVDVGQVYVYMGHLRRAVDAGSLAAAAQYREGRAIHEMRDSAEEVMHLNGIDPAAVLVETCDTTPKDSALCVVPKRKFVRVTGELDVPMAFLHFIGFNSVRINANAISEAASMDVVLVIDISESMAGDASLCDEDDDDGDGVADDGRPDLWCSGKPGIPVVGKDWDNYNADPSRCNVHNACQPMEKVKAAADTFVRRVLDQPANQEADRLAIVTFSNGWESPGDRKGTRVVPPGWINSSISASNVVNNLQIYQPEACPANIGPCRNYDTGNASGNYIGFECHPFRLEMGGDGNPASCTTTNIGGGLKQAGNLYGLEPREDALWVVILLTDGAANASDADASHAYGYCPPSAWDSPFCRDLDSKTRHASGNANYDADDFARDMADFVGCHPLNPASDCDKPGQGAIIFTIGLGDQVLQKYGTDPIPHGVALLRYIAAVGDDGNPATDACQGRYGNLSEWKSWCGNYYFDATGDKLTRVFEDIASRMFTRITH